MPEHSAEMLRCIRDIDVEAARRLWKHERPGLAQPENDYQATMLLHYSRTLTAKVPDHLRFYSHRWLYDNNFPSGLPDPLRPRAERMYPRVVNAVGTASGSGPGRKGPFNYAVEKVMSDAVKEAYADGHEHEPDIVRARILEKRAEFKRRA